MFNLSFLAKTNYKQYTPLKICISPLGKFFFKVVEDIWEDRPVHSMNFRVINGPEILSNSSLLWTLSVNVSQSVVSSSWMALLHHCSLPSGAWPLPPIHLHTAHVYMKMSLLLGLKCADIKTALSTALLIKDWNFPLKLLLQLKFWLLERKNIMGGGDKGSNFSDCYCYTVHISYILYSNSGQCSPESMFRLNNSKPRQH